jgi:hypothetical protein
VFTSGEPVRCRGDCTVQIEATAVPFEIDGTDLGNGVLGVSSGPLSNVVITSYSNTSITGTFSVNMLYQPGQYTVTVTPSGATTTINVVAGPSTVSTGSPGIWYLGNASTNDSCAATGVCYDNSTVVSLNETGYQAPPTATAPGTWQLTDPRTGQPPAFASVACNDPTCALVDGHCDIDAAEHVVHTGDPNPGDSGTAHHPTDHALGGRVGHRVNQQERF